MCAGQWASLCLLAAILACGQPQDRLIGTWVLDAEATSGVKSPVDLGGLLGALDLSLTITADRMTMNVFGQRQEGPYKVVSHGGDRYVLEIQAEGAAEQVTLTLKEDRLMFAGEDGQQVTLKRKT